MRKNTCPYLLLTHLLQITDVRVLWDAVTRPFENNVLYVVLSANNFFFDPTAINKAVAYFINIFVCNGLFVSNSPQYLILLSLGSGGSL